jgi:hypothetical protein
MMLMIRAGGPRRSRRLPAASTVEQFVAMGAVVTLAMILLFAFIDSRPDSSVTADQTSLIETATTTADAGVPPATSEPSEELAPVTVEPATVDADLEAIGVVVELNQFTIADDEAVGLYRNDGTGPVNVRSEPGIDASLLGQIQVGDSVLPMSTGRSASDASERWIEVEYLDITGWVRADLLTPADAN